MNLSYFGLSFGKPVLYLFSRKSLFEYTNDDLALTRPIIKLQVKNNSLLRERLCPTTVRRHLCLLTCVPMELYYLIVYV